MAQANVQHESSRAALALLQASLQKLIGLHRQLMDFVRTEKDALVQADLRTIQEVTGSKQVLIESIRQEESNRLKHVAELAMCWKRPLRDLSLSQIAVEIQGVDPKGAEQLRSAFNALTILIKRVSDQNRENSRLVEKTLEHLNAMKKNVLGEATPASATYTQQGTRASGTSGSRLISKEA